VWLVNVHIPEYDQGTWTNHEPRRPRKLLLHDYEINR
jgi:SsrA-binding protein